MAALCATARTRSFSKAATTLGMTPSGTSKLVARLEHRLGVRLLQRTTRAMQLTEAGELYYERATRVLDELDGLERDLEGHHRQPTGRIQVTAPTVLGGDLLMPVVIEFQRRFPEVTVEVELTDREVDVMTEGFDIAVRMTDHPPASCVARKLGADVRRLCASPGYLRRRPRPESPGDLATHRCIVLTTPNGPLGWHLRSAPDGPAEPFACQGSLALNNIAAIHQAVLAGLGIGDLPAYMVEDQLASGRLISLLEPYLQVRRTIYALYAPSRLMPAKTREFLKVLESKFQVRRAQVVDDAPH